LKRNFEIQLPKKCEDQFEEAERDDRKDNKWKHEENEDEDGAITYTK
jgi:hypothetical protein